MREPPLTKPGFGHIAARRLQQLGPLNVQYRNPARSRPFWMKRLISLAWFAAISALPFPQTAQAQRAEYDSLVATHAQANGLPEALVHRVIVRESRYQPHLVGRGGTIGLMQIKLATARSLGYAGDAAGLRDPNTNLTYAVKYLAGAYRAANGDHNRAVSYYASGYYAAEKRHRLALSRHEQAARVDGLSGNPVDARAQVRRR